MVVKLKLYKTYIGNWKAKSSVSTIFFYTLTILNIAWALVTLQSAKKEKKKKKKKQ